jgi:hypothetical protein
LLFVLDEPALPATEPREGEPEQEPKSAPTLELSVGPASLLLRGRF